MDDYPSNSNRQREAEPQDKKKATTRPATKEEKKIESIVKGSVRQRKKPLFKRIRETFTGSENTGVMEYVLLDVMVPAAKDMMADATSLGVERLLFGESRSRPRRGRSAGYQAYNRAYSSGTTAYRRDPAYEPERGREISSRARSHHDFGEIIIESRGEAEQVIDTMFELLSKYKTVSVSDLYDLVDITGNYTDEKWGWTELRGAGVERVRDGYLLSLPMPEPLER